MTPDYLTMKVAYNMKTEKFRIYSDVKKSQQSNLLAEYLRGQMGAGEDKSKPKVRDVYHIELKWYPSNDDFVVSSDTGNKGLRDGILMSVLKGLKGK